MEHLFDPGKLMIKVIAQSQTGILEGLKDCQVTVKKLFIIMKWCAFYNLIQTTCCLGDPCPIDTFLVLRLKMHFNTSANCNLTCEIIGGKMQHALDFCAYTRIINMNPNEAQLVCCLKGKFCSMSKVL